MVGWYYDEAPLWVHLTQRYETLITLNIMHCMFDIMLATKTHGGSKRPRASFRKDNPHEVAISVNTQS